MKMLRKAIGYLSIVAVLTLGVAFLAYPVAVTQIAGLAVAQSTTKWNSLKDIAVGDAQTSGVGLFSPCLWNGTSCDRQRGTITGGALVGGGSTPANNFANPTAAALTTWSLGGLFDGTTWDEWIGVSNTNNTATTSQGAAYVTPLSTWSVVNTSSLSVTPASASKAAGGGTVRHVATGLTYCLSDTAGADATARLVHLRDGATGAGTILRTFIVNNLQVGGAGFCQSLTGLNMTGSANTAMTIELAAATLVTSVSSVTLTGYSTP